MKRVLALLVFSLMASHSFGATVIKTGVISKIHTCIKSNGGTNHTILEFKVDDKWFRAASLGGDGSGKMLVAQHHTILSVYLAGKPLTVTFSDTVTDTFNNCGVSGSGDDPSSGAVYPVWDGSGAYLTF